MAARYKKPKPGYVTLTPAEWSLMEFMWEHPDCLAREAVAHCAQTVGWARTTTLTILRHLVEKGAVRCDASDTLNRYAPIIDREETVRRETDTFLERIYHGSVSMMLTAMTKKQQLSAEDVETLRTLLREAEGGGEK